MNAYLHDKFVVIIFKKLFLIIKKIKFLLIGSDVLCGEHVPIIVIKIVITIIIIVLQ